MDINLAPTNLNLKHPEFMGVQIRDDGYCKFCGRIPTLGEYNLYTKQAEELSKNKYKQNGIIYEKILQLCLKLKISIFTQ